MGDCGRKKHLPVIAYVQAVAHVVRGCFHPDTNEVDSTLFSVVVSLYRYVPRQCPRTARG